MHRSNSTKVICCCGSNLPTEDIFDARGIFVARVCAACKKRKLSEYRPEIFEDVNYEVNEQTDSNWADNEN